jgi:hypothetical protein
MKHTRAVAVICLTLLLMSVAAFGQSTGDFRSHQSGDWSAASTWEQYNGSTWVTPAPALPDSLTAVTIRTGDIVTITGGVIRSIGNGTIQSGAQLAVSGVGDTLNRLVIANGTLTVDGTLTQKDSASAVSPYSITVLSTGTLVIADGGTFQQDQGGGGIPKATWADGSTLLVTGVKAGTSVGANARNNYYNVVWNNPAQSANCGLGLQPDTTVSSTWDTSFTIRGNVTVISSGTGRLQLCGPDAGTASHRNSTRITINGNIKVLNGANFSSNGTSKGFTDISVTVLGNVWVGGDSVFITAGPPAQYRWSQLSISRGSQAGSGTSVWYLKGDSIYYGRKTTNQNSTDANTAATAKGRFIFCKPGTQYVTLDDSIAWTGECNMQFGDSSTVTRIECGNSPFGGSGASQRITPNATVVLGPNGYIGGGTNSNTIASNFTLDNGATLIIGSENGIRASLMGSSGAVRVSGTRDYGTAANFEYRGIANQRLGSGFPATANNLTIDNPLGVYVDSLTTFTINGTLTCTSGHLDLDSANLVLGPTAQLAETPGNTVTSGRGVITTTRTLSSPLGSTNIAGMGLYIGSSADLGSTVIVRGHQSQGSIPGSSVKRYFAVTPTTNTGLAATVVYQYDASELNGQLPSLMKLWSSTNSGSSWTALVTTNDAVNYKVTATGLDGLNMFTGSNGGTPHLAYLNSGWNMISVPYVIADPRKTVLFPDATSRAFTYITSYVQRDSLFPGTGYWLKVAAKDTVGIIGEDVTSVSVNVNTGWNMIGSISTQLPAKSITSTPPSILTSNFFGYSGNYKVTDTLYPGKAYWVKSTQAGQLTLAATGFASNAKIRIVPGADVPPSPPEADAPAGTLQLPSSFALHTAYPNPFNPSTDISYAVADAKRITVKIYDILGREVVSLVDRVQEPGEYTIRWNASNIPSGIYFVRMNTESFNAVQKLMLMK